MLVLLCLLFLFLLAGFQRCAPQPPSLLRVLLCSFSDRRRLFGGALLGSSGSSALVPSFLGGLLQTLS